MTPKEKANELVQKFYFSLPNNGAFEGICNINQRWEEGKKCALIAVDEIYKLRMTHGQYLDYDVDKINYYSYWEQVKTEIENL